MALPKLHTIKDLFDSPSRTSASISPDGTRMAFLAPWRNRLNIWVQDLDDASGPRAVTADETRSQSQNRRIAVERLAAVLNEAAGAADVVCKFLPQKL